MRPRNTVSNLGSYLNSTRPPDIVIGYTAPGGGSVQSPLTVFISLSSPTYWPSNRVDPCAQATFAKTAASSRPTPCHFTIPFPPSDVTARFFPPSNLSPTNLFREGNRELSPA